MTLIAVYAVYCMDRIRFRWWHVPCWVGFAAAAAVGEGVGRALVS